MLHQEFLSTPSARRATVHPDPQDHLQQISIHALREEGDGKLIFQVIGICISIHALREEGDVALAAMILTGCGFLSTPSARRATYQAQELEAGIQISIHALREEGDLSTSCTAVEKLLFLSTPSARRATMVTSPSRERLLNFYPRPPRGGRPVESRFYTCKSCISIHALPKEGDFRKIKTLLNGIMISIHALRKEGDAEEAVHGRGCKEFLSTPSARRATLGIGAILPPDRYFYPRPPQGGRPSSGYRT